MVVERPKRRRELPVALSFHRAVCCSVCEQWSPAWVGGRLQRQRSKVLAHVGAEVMMCRFERAGARQCRPSGSGAGADNGEGDSAPERGVIASLALAGMSYRIRS